MPGWLAEMEFCHIRPEDDSATTFYCGQPVDEGITCEDYDGEAICPTCGSPTCPRCAQMADLDDRLEDE